MARERSIKQERVTEMAKEKEENGAVEIPAELVQSYKNGLQNDDQLKDQVLRKSYEITKIREKQDEIVEVLASAQKEEDKLNNSREELHRALKDLQNQMEDVCKLDRNKQWRLDIDGGVFVEFEGQPLPQ